MKHTILLAASALTMLASATAFAEDAAPAKWSDTLKLGVQIDAGLTLNPASPTDKLNFGHLFTDRANEALLNQTLVTYGRPLDPKATGYDFGFKLQGLYGTDARYTHFLRLMDRATKGRTQFDITEASVSLHSPGLTAGGIDFQAGLWPTPLGYETIDPSTNPFYSHSYIFNFGLPFKHSGANAIFHVSDMVDFYVAATAGTNTIAGFDNNGGPGFIVGTKLTLLDGKLTVLALTHNGPENATLAYKNANSFNRSYNDMSATYKATDALTLVTELNYVRDDLFRAEGFGFAQYASYALTDTTTLNVRGEVFRDTRGFFVAAFPTSLGPVLAQEGYAAPSVSYGKTTYGALTIGATYKPALPEKFGADGSLMIRPELRYDTSLNGGARYNAGKDSSALTISADAVLSF